MLDFINDHENASTKLAIKLSNLRYCSDVCSGTTCHKGNEISSGRNDYPLCFNKTH